MSTEFHLDGSVEKMEDELDQEIVPDLDTLTELGNIGAGNAATALSTMIDKKISIDVPTTHLVSPDKIPDILKFYDMHTVAVIQQLAFDDDCVVLLVLPVEEANKLVRIIAEGQEEDLNLELIDELGNIIIGNFLNAISDFTGVTLMSVPPIHVVDLFDAILDIFLAQVTLQNRNAILFEARLRCEDEDIHEALLMFLNDELQTKLIEQGEDWLNF